jgi:hypothetical protein
MDTLGRIGETHTPMKMHKQSGSRTDKNSFFSESHQDTENMERILEFEG